MLHSAMYYKTKGDQIECLLCPHHCLIKKGQFGLCSVRSNQDGQLKTINYGEVTTMAIDPIEKKPLYHFKPGTNILSVGSFGCNFSCDFCQNYSIAQYKAESQYLSSEELIEKCVNWEDNIGIAFTYNEPSIWYEYIYDTAKKLKESHPDFQIVLVTNGYIEPEPLEKLLPYIDAMNIDLKSFQEDYYKKVCGGSLEPVLRTIEKASQRCHVEITTLLVSGLNDSEEEVREIASFLGNLNKDIPLHLARYYPTYKMDRPATDLKIMLEAKEIAKQYLNYVYIGNVASADRSTYCPGCGKLLVGRDGLLVISHFDQNLCPNCGYVLNIVGNEKG